MKWKNLNDYHCPKCKTVMYRPENHILHFCSNVNECGFSISDVKFKKIVSGKKNYAVPYEEPDRTGWE